MRLDDIDDVLVSIPRQFYGSERVIPAKVHGAESREVVGNFEGLAFDRILRNREDAARAQDRNTLGARVTFMRGIAGDDLLPLFGGEVLRLLDSHPGDAAIGRALLQE